MNKFCQVRMVVNTILVINMTEKRFLCINNVVFVNAEKKLTLEEIKLQLMNQKPLISDEEAFERYLIRKWKND